MELALHLPAEQLPTAPSLSETRTLLGIMSDTNPKTLNSNRGFSLIELLLVLTIAAILSAVAIPVMVAQRRLLRSAAVTREIMTQLRYTRQLSISTRQSITFRYDDATKQITIINQNNNHLQLADPVFPGCFRSRTQTLVAAGFPMVPGCSRVVLSIPLTQGGLTASEISYGIPAGSALPLGAPAIPTIALDDNIVMTPLASGKLDITFQADGSVVDALGIPLNRAMFLYNNKAALATTSAISVLGASGRVKAWRYTPVGNHFVE